MFKVQNILDKNDHCRKFLQERVEPEPEIAAKAESVIVNKPEPIIIDEPEPELKVAAKSEPTIIDEPKPTVVDEPEPEPKIEKSLVKTSSDLSAELAMELETSTLVLMVPASPRSLDVYDSLQIYLQETVTRDQVILDAKYKV